MLWYTIAMRALVCRQAQNWTLAAFELQEIKEAFDAVVEQNPEHAISSRSAWPISCRR
jgi:hypothetical protein